MPGSRAHTLISLFLVAHIPAGLVFASFAASDFTFLIQQWWEISNCLCERNSMLQKCNFSWTKSLKCQLYLFRRRQEVVCFPSHSFYEMASGMGWGQFISIDFKMSIHNQLFSAQHPIPNYITNYFVLFYNYGGYVRGSWTVATGTWPDCDQPPIQGSFFFWSNHLWTPTHPLCICDHELEHTSLTTQTSS